MSKAAFSVNDLLRRKLQTSLTVATLTLSVASTLFLLLFSRRIGWGITSIGNSLTYGLSAVFSQFILFIGVLIFTVGAVITSFIIFLMMKQRTLDFGLIKAAGCPNGLVFGYFMTELLVVTCLGCVLGIVLGFASDFTITQIFHFQAYQKTQDLWLAPVVFVAFFGLCLVFGAKPMLDAARVSPIKALSPVQYFGLTTGNKLKPLSRFGLTLKLASRSFVRRQSASVRIVILLSIVFLLLTVSIAGGVIAKDTTSAWVENAMGTNVVVIAHNSMGTKYMQLLSTFTGAAENDDFNYIDTKLAVSDTLIQQLESMPSLETVDARLMFKANVREVSNFTINPETLATLPVGDSREDDSLIVGVDPQKLTASWSVSGRFFAGEEADAAVIGDSISQTMFSSDSHAGIHRADPLVQGIRLQNWTFNIIGVVVDPINNGKVTYVSLEKLQNLTGILDVNVVLVKIDSFANHSEVLAQIKSEVSKADVDFSVFELDEVRQQNLGFLSSVWAAVMLLPLFALTSATLCLIGYSMLAVDEQRQEFAVLRIMGVKPKTVVSILAVQSIFVLISSLSVGVSIGIIITLVILMSQPVVTLFSILEIVGWLSAALVGLLILSLWPAVRFAKKPILKIMS
jgi:ABC-type antimicrobial peptide transport system permease subunit